VPTPIDRNTVELHFAFTQPKNATREQQAFASTVINMIAFQAEQEHSDLGA
jgi:hypothetical protein